MKILKGCDVRLCKNKIFKTVSFDEQNKENGTGQILLEKDVCRKHFIEIRKLNIKFFKFGVEKL